MIKIINKILHFIREKCGYYELEKDYKELRKLYSKEINMSSIKDKKIQELYLLNNNIRDPESKYEAKILEYDILDHKFLELVDIVNNNNTMMNFYDLEEIIKYYNKGKQNDYKKYLIQELEQILNIMRDKGIHPQDLIKRIIYKANKEMDRSTELEINNNNGIQ